MAIRAPNEAPTRVSAELSVAIQGLVNDPEHKEPPTLGAVRADLEMTGLRWSPNVESLHPHDRTAHLIDLVERTARERPRSISSSPEGSEAGRGRSRPR
jgi:hypothetical protein